MRLFLPIVLFASTLSLGLGMVLPLIRIDRLLLFTDEPSLLAIVSGLWWEGEMLLSAVIALFSIGAYPVWSIVVLAIDGLIIYALTVHGIGEE